MGFGLGRSASLSREQKEYNDMLKVVAQQTMQEFVTAMPGKVIDMDAVERATGWPVGIVDSQVDLEPLTMAGVQKSVLLINQPSVVGWTYTDKYTDTRAFIHPYPNHPGWKDGTFIVSRNQDNTPLVEGTKGWDGAHADLQELIRRFPTITHVKKAALRTRHAPFAPSCLQYADLKWVVGIEDYRRARGLD